MPYRSGKRFRRNPPAAFCSKCRKHSTSRNGLIESFFRNLKEECVWQHNFASFAEARATITEWIEWDNRERPRHALGYRSPPQFRGYNLNSWLEAEGSIHASIRSKGPLRPTECGCRASPTNRESPLRSKKCRDISEPQFGAGATNPGGAVPMPDLL